MSTGSDAGTRFDSAASRAAGRLMPIFQYRYGTGVARLRAAVDAGLCGRLYLATSETAWFRDAAYYSTPWHGTLAGEGGGTVLLHGTHAHDLLTHVAGPLATIQGQVATLVNEIETEDCATAFGTVVVHVAPEAAVGGPLAAVRDGDLIELDVPGRRLDLLVAEDEVARRLASRPQRQPHYRRGYGWMFARHILQAHHGCDFDFLRAQR